MTKTFAISDAHFHHANSLTFKRDDGSPMRSFSCVEEMDETMIQNWNRVVSSEDRVYFVGDFTMPRKGLEILNRLNGRICVILGNHDPWKLSDWMKYSPHKVDTLQGVKMFPKLGWILTHIPVHEDQFYGRWTCNIHGHTHWREKMKDGKIDPRYFNVSVECIDYTPIEFEDLKSRIEERQKSS